MFSEPTFCKILSVTRMTCWRHQQELVSCIFEIVEYLDLKYSFIHYACTASIRHQGSLLTPMIRSILYSLGNTEIYPSSFCHWPMCIFSQSNPCSTFFPEVFFYQFLACAGRTPDYSGCLVSIVDFMLYRRVRVSIRMCFDAVFLLSQRLPSSQLLFDVVAFARASELFLKRVVTGESHTDLWWAASVVLNRCSVVEIITDSVHCHFSLQLHWSRTHSTTGFHGSWKVMKSREFFVVIYAGPEKSWSWMQVLNKSW